MIEGKDISFVIQGRINDPIFVQKLCNDMRNNFLNCEIIISTTDPKINFDFDSDLILYNEDPGKDDPFDDEWHGNSKRQILNSQRGLSKSTRKYSMKIRSDASFVDKNFLEDYYKHYDYYRLDKYKIFEQRVCVVNLWTSKSEKYHYFVSDLFYFGLTEDVKSIFDCPYNRYDKETEWYSEKYLNFLETKPGDCSCVEKSLCIWPAYKSGKIDKLYHSDFFDYIYTNYYIIDFNKFGFKIDRHYNEYCQHINNQDFFHNKDWIEISEKYKKT